VAVDVTLTYKGMARLSCMKQYVSQNRPRLSSGERVVVRLGLLDLVSWMACFYEL